MLQAFYFVKKWILDHERFGTDLWKGKWCKFEMDVIEYTEGNQMKTKTTIKGILMLVTQIM